VLVRVGVNVDVAPVEVAVGVLVRVGVLLAVGVLVRVGVLLAVGVLVRVDVMEGVLVRVGVPLAVGVCVLVRVEVGVDVEAPAVKSNQRLIPPAKIACWSALFEPM